MARPYNSPLMSQITRCPSCSTSFKVVADQLRISQGWVRCGHCKEVFDASAHLLPAAPAPLLPDVSLTDVRPPLAPVARKADAERAWGEHAAPAAPPAPASPAERPGVSNAPAFELFPTGASESDMAREAPLAPLVLAEPPVQPEVLEVPPPAVPAFLSSVGGVVTSDEELRLTRLTPFAWRAEAAPHPPTVKLDEPKAPALVKTLAPVPAAPQTVPAPAPASAAVNAPGEAPGAGYELPFAQLREDSDEDSLGPVVLAGPAPLSYPPLDVPEKPAAATEPGASAGVGPTVAGLKEPAPVQPLPPVDYLKQPAAQSDETMALVDDDSPAAVLRRPPKRKAAPAHAEPDGDDDGEEEDAEVSFVVAARRKAFWRKPIMRALLAVLLLASFTALVLQIAVQERDRLAASYVGARPWLAALCGPLHCELAPQRQIADVVIDSSSFSKARGDSYQLALTMKSKAGIALAMPAVELTLTDAQDQPVLRRVLLPTDLGAPVELPARGEWSTSVSVIVTTGGARVAGYRLLAFYP